MKVYCQKTKAKQAKQAKQVTKSLKCGAQKFVRVHYGKSVQFQKWFLYPLARQYNTGNQHYTSRWWAMFKLHTLTVMSKIYRFVFPFFFNCVFSLISSLVCWMLQFCTKVDCGLQ